MSRTREHGYDDEVSRTRSRRTGAYAGDHVVDEDELVEDEPTHRERRPGGTPRRGVEVHGERIAVGRTHSDVGLREARRGFGGLDLPATFVGMLTALALLVLLAGLVGAAIGVVGYQTGVEGSEGALSIAGLVGGLIVLAVSFFVGGWAAGRIARYDGGLNGLMAGVWVVALGAITAALGAWLGSEYDVLRTVQLPQFFSRDAVTVGGIVSALVAIAAMLGWGWFGGRRGEGYHRGVDATIADTRAGGIDS